MGDMCDISKYVQINRVYIYICIYLFTLIPKPSDTYVPIFRGLYRVILGDGPDHGSDNTFGGLGTV